jgi:hypothetical protein
LGAAALLEVVGETDRLTRVVLFGRNGKALLKDGIQLFDHVVKLADAQQHAGWLPGLSDHETRSLILDLAKQRI